jgi:hypothetical protein
VQELKVLLKEQPAAIKEKYGGKLEFEYPIEMGMHTIEQMLTLTIFQEGIHLQAILDLKKCLRVRCRQTNIRNKKTPIQRELNGCFVNITKYLL